MKEYIKIAWRNIWRNKRRTLITAASILFAVFFAIILNSLQSGAWSYLLNNLVEEFSGHLQVQHKDYFKNPSINYLVPYTKDLTDKLDTSNEIVSYTPMFQSGALASTGEQSKIAIIMGLETNEDNGVSNIKKNMINIYFSEAVINKLINKNIPNQIIEKIQKLETKYYKNKTDLLIYLKLADNEIDKYIETIIETAKFNAEYLSPNNDGVLVGFELAKYLEISVGDSIIVIGQGYHGASAAGKYPIKALLKFPSSDFNNSIIYTDIKNAQILYSAYELNENSNDTTFLVNFVRINTNTPVTVDKNNVENIRKVRDEVASIINDEQLAVLDWSKVNSEMTQIAYSKQGSAKIISGLLYIIVGFGVFGTVLMMVTERRREFGIMVAIGMKKTKLAFIFAIEMFFLGILGIISGSIASMPIVLLGHYYPIKYSGDAAEVFSNFNVEPVLVFANIGTYYFNQAFTILFIVGLVIIFPLIKIIRLNVIKSIKD